MDDLSNMVFDIKEKLTDGEYKGLMEKMADVKINTKFPYEITYIKQSLHQDGEGCDGGQEIEIKSQIKKGYAMINESDEETIRTDIETYGVSQVHFRLFREIMGDKPCCCHEHNNGKPEVHITVLDDCEIDIKYNTYFINVVKIKQLR
jgi:hypothetical protein